MKTHKDKHEWMKAMQDEMHSLCKNDTYELFELQKGKYSVGNKWVFKHKSDTVKLVKFKARLVI